MRALRALALEHRLERVEPLLRLERIRIVRGGQLGNGGHGLLLGFWLWIYSGGVSQA